MCFIMKTCNFFRISIEAKKIHRVLEFNRSKWLKQFFEFNTIGDKDQRWKSIVKINEQYCLWSSNGKCEKWN